jgi:hypothetical protein
MYKKTALAALAAVTLAASAAPASAQVYYRGYDRWGPGVSVGIGFEGPGVGVRVGSGYYDDGRAYAAAPGYGCSCANRAYYQTSYAPRYRSSSYAYEPSYAGYSNYAYAGDYYSNYAYAGDYYDGGYASVGFGWSDNGPRYRRSRANYDVRYRNREARFGFESGNQIRTQANIRSRENVRVSNRATQTTLTARTGNSSSNAFARGNVRVNGANRRNND